MRDERPRLKTENSKLITDAARSLVGTPFRHQGVDRLGLDCSGLLICLCREIGYEMADHPRDHQREADADRLRAGLEHDFESIEASNCQPGDIALIQFPRETSARHLGIVVAGIYEWEVVHAIGGTTRDGSRTGVVADPWRKWEPYAVAGYRFRELQFSNSG